MKNKWVSKYKALKKVKQKKNTADQLYAGRILMKFMRKAIQKKKEMRMERE